jgi:hypothetical protein
MRSDYGELAISGTGFGQRLDTYICDKDGCMEVTKTRMIVNGRTPVTLCEKHTLKYLRDSHARRQ